MKKAKLGLIICFLAPAFILYTTFVIASIALSISYTFVDWSGAGKATFAGLDNYIRLVQDPDYWTVTKNTIVLVFLSVVIQNPLGIGLAYLTSRTKIGYRFIRSSIFMPVVISSVATGLMFSLFLNNDIGIFNNFLKTVGLGFLQNNWLSNPKIVLYSVAIPQVWQYLGIHYMIYLAGIQSIPTAIYESAKIDGANSFVTLWRIVIPMLRNVLLICIVLNVTGSLKAFDISWIMTWGGPGKASSYISTYMFKMAINGSEFSYGMTVAVTILFYATLFTVFFYKIFPKDDLEF